MNFDTIIIGVGILCSLYNFNWAWKRAQTTKIRFFKDNKEVKRDGLQAFIYKWDAVVAWGCVVLLEISPFLFTLR